MKRSFFILISALWILTSSFSPAIVDENQNTLSDLWEKQYNNGQLFGASFDAQGDEDGDGWSNAKEAVSGTDPLDGTPPVGLLTPETIHHPSVWVDTDNDGIADTQTAETAEIKWPSLIGKQYQLYSSPDLTPETWLEVDEPRMGTGGEIGLGIPLAQPDGSVPERLFWRVAVRDVDTDGDGLADHEEHQFGSNPSLADTDGDGINDLNEYLLGTHPAVPRIWAFQEIPNADGTVTFTWNSYASDGDWFQIESQQPDGTWTTCYSTTYGSAQLPFVTGSHSYSLTLNPATDYLP